MTRTPKFLFQCNTCGHTTVIETLAETTDEQCPMCDFRGLEKIPFTSGYDAPHMLNIWVRADSLEYVSAQQNIGGELAERASRIDTGDADCLRDLAALIEARLAELDVARLNPVK